MVDEYTGVNTKIIVKKEVQIPLWSMNTRHTHVKKHLMPLSSDSSMVDEYPLGSAVNTSVTRSDSSMVDEYTAPAVDRWSMERFRFLYGR